MIKTIFLGTGGSTPTKARGLPAIAIEHEGEVFLLDCGEGTQRQAMTFGVNIARIRAIFISHAHGDHILGLAGLVRTMALNQRQKSLQIFVPAGEEKYVNTLLTFDRALIGYPIEVKGIRSGTVYKGDDFTVSAFKLNHMIDTVGYAFKENDRVRFITEKCAKLGIKDRMFRQILDDGYIKIQGKRISLASVTYKVMGKCVVYATDTRPTASTVKAVAGADVLIHESSYTDDLKDMAKERYHSTVAEAAAVAKKARCKSLLLFHLSARYKDTTAVLKEARKIFKNTNVAEDGTTITL